MRRHGRCELAFLSVAFVAVVSTALPMERNVSFQEAQQICQLINTLGTKDDQIYSRISAALQERGGKAVPFLVFALTNHADPKVRYQVARILGQIRDQRSIDPLFQASMLDPDQVVRGMAKASLDLLIERLNTPLLGDRVTKDYRKLDRGSIFSLRKRLRNDANPSVRRSAAIALGEYGDERDLDTLFDVAREDSVNQVRLAAVKAIVNIAYPILLSGEYRVTFWGTLTYGPDSFRERLVRDFVERIKEEPDSSVRLELVKGLTRLVFPTFLIGEEAFGPFFSLRARSRDVILLVRDAFVSLLRREKEPVVRKEAAASLTKLFMALFDKGDRLANEEMRRSLLTQKRAYDFYPFFPGRIRYFYRRTLDYFPSRAYHLLEPVREALLRAYLTDPDPGVRREAIAGLSYLGRENMTTTVLQHLRDERNGDVWLASVEALGQLGGKTAAEALLGVYRNVSNNRELRKAAVLSIGQIGNREVTRKLASFLAVEGDRQVKLAILGALSYGRDACTAAVLAKAAQDRGAEIRAAAVEAAGKNFTSETIGIFKDLLKNDPSEEVRAAACISLSKALRKDAADHLIVALEDPAASVRKAAVIELGLHRAVKSLDGLATVLLEDADASVRAEAGTSLGNIGSHGSVKPLIAAVSHDPDPLVREKAFQALLKTDEPRTAIIAILTQLPRLVGENPLAYRELNNALPYLQQQAHGRVLSDQ